MPRRPQVPLRTAVFVGVEGKSDRAFARFLQRCFDEDNTCLNLDIKPGSGGDSLDVVKMAVHHLKKRPSGKNYYRKIVLLDKDRMEEDKQRGRDAHTEAKQHGLEIIIQNPNLEGLLLRLHPGNERNEYQPKGTERKLKKIWPQYKKSQLNADLLCQRFAIADLRRAAKHDPQLKRLIGILEGAVAEAGNS